MLLRQLTSNAALSVLAWLAIAVAAPAADMPVMAPTAPSAKGCVTTMRETDVLEVQPGITKIIKVTCQNRNVQAIVVGNPNVAFANPINMGSLAVTGKGVGLTNIALLDEQGEMLSSFRVQVVDGTAFGGDFGRVRHEVRVIHMDNAATKVKANEARYLCGGKGCSSIQVDEPLALNPPGGTNAPATSTQKTDTTVTYQNAPARGP